MLKGLVPVSTQSPLINSLLQNVLTISGFPAETSNKEFPETIHDLWEKRLWSWDLILAKEALL